MLHGWFLAAYSERDGVHLDGCLCGSKGICVTDEGPENPVGALPSLQRAEWIPWLMTTIGQWPKRTPEWGGLEFAFLQNRGIGTSPRASMWKKALNAELRRAPPRQRTTCGDARNESAQGSVTNKGAKTVK